MSKNYQKLWKDQIRGLARKNMARRSLAREINRDDPGSAFDLVVTLIEDGDEDDQVLLRTFRDAKLNVNDPFHWWQLLHDLIMIHTDRPVGASRIWTPEKIKKLERDSVTVGRHHPPTISIAEVCKRLKSELRYEQTPQNLQFIISRLGLTDRIKEKIRHRK
ncbi:hypothetical protein [Bradyrhizobium sp. CCGUVB23]|uniref:hypothetical protein n=1 Tax=Bradyrhizobium sp. CCGUVB23 TaxID=2949630 RepID=UPI0020B21614|nr:hypothetical protein [Bradyrhizobium sp. CCGUVB23]MCP3462145.1 hypothetical protein [Bradyrhizobium sp. CCGUVB23]